MGGKRQVAIISLVIARGLQLVCARVLHEGLLGPVLLYGSYTLIYREKERSRIRAVQMDNFRGLLGVMRMNRAPNARSRELCGVPKGFDENVVRWFGHIERMENDRIAKRVYVGESVCRSTEEEVD